MDAAPGTPLAGAVVPVGPKPGTPGDVGELDAPPKPLPPENPPNAELPLPDVPPVPGPNAELPPLDVLPAPKPPEVAPPEGKGRPPDELSAPPPEEPVPELLPAPEPNEELAPPPDDPKPLLPLSNCARAEPPPSSHPATRKAIQRRLKVMENANVQGGGVENRLTRSKRAIALSHARKARNDIDARGFGNAGRSGEVESCGNG